MCHWWFIENRYIFTRCYITIGTNTYIKFHGTYIHTCIHMSAHDEIEYIHIPFAGHSAIFYLSQHIWLTFFIRICRHYIIIIWHKYIFCFKMWNKSITVQGGTHTQAHTHTYAIKYPGLVFYKVVTLTWTVSDFFQFYL